MEYTMWDKTMKIDKLQLNYEAHMVGCDGEMFYYSIYFENAVDKACDEFGEDYIGYIDINIKDNIVSIYHDTGNVEDCDSAVRAVLKSLNNVTGIKNVVINEGCDDYGQY